jgi:hypothetical protein
MSDGRLAEFEGYTKHLSTHHDLLLRLADEADARTEALAARFAALSAALSEPVAERQVDDRGNVWVEFTAAEWDTLRELLPDVIPPAPGPLPKPPAITDLEREG